MMNERLKLAKNLLKNDGVIFVSIDDSEQAYLKVLMDEIFGEENFTCNFVWEKNYAPKNNNKFVSVNHDYILCYCKNKILKNKFNRNQRTEKNNRLYFYKDDRGFYKSSDLTKKGSNNIYDIIWDGKKYLCPKNSSWLYNEEKMYELIKQNRIFLPENENNRPFLKKYLNEVDDVISLSILKYEVVNHTDGSKKQLDSILDNHNFNTPKPIELIKYLINIASTNNARILDFFAGSGTTGHAVLALNKEDGGNRTFTIVTNNENEIGTNVCYERLYRINNGFGTKNETDFDWINKNKPYLNNLNVYDLKYFDTNPIKIDNNEIKEAFTKMLVDFNDASQSNLFDSNQRELLINLSTLKSINNK